MFLEERALRMIKRKKAEEITIFFILRDGNALSFIDRIEA